MQVLESIVCDFLAVYLEGECVELDLIGLVLLVGNAKLTLVAVCGIDIVADTLGCACLGVDEDAYAALEVIAGGLRGAGCKPGCALELLAVLGDCKQGGVCRNVALKGDSIAVIGGSLEPYIALGEACCGENILHRKADIGHGGLGACAVGGGSLDLVQRVFRHHVLIDLDAVYHDGKLGNGHALDFLGSTVIAVFGGRVAAGAKCEHQHCDKQQ